MTEPEPWSGPASRTAPSTPAGCSSPERAAGKVPPRRRGPRARRATDEGPGDLAVGGLTAGAPLSAAREQHDPVAMESPLDTAGLAVVQERRSVGCGEALTPSSPRQARGEETPSAHAKTTFFGRTTGFPAQFGSATSSLRAEPLPMDVNVRALAGAAGQPGTIGACRSNRPPARATPAEARPRRAAHPRRGTPTRASPRASSRARPTPPAPRRCPRPRPARRR